MWESDALERLNWHCHHCDTSCSKVIPYSDYWVFSLLSWGYQISLHINIKATNRGWMTKEEPSLLICLSIHCNESSSRWEKNDIFAIISWPFECATHFRLESNDVFEFHNWIFVKFMRSGQLISTILTRNIVRCPWSIRLFLYTATWTKRWLLKVALIIILDDIATHWVISWSSIKLHIELFLHVWILFFLILLIYPLYEL